MMKCKNIIESKTCLLCEREKSERGLTILGNYICNKCVDEITNLSICDNKYEVIKSKLRGILINR